MKICSFYLYQQSKLIESKDIFQFKFQSLTQGKQIYDESINGSIHQSIAI